MKLSEQQKFSLLIILGTLTAIGPLSIDMYLPAFNAIAEDLHTNMSSVGLSLTSYFIGYSFGQLLYGPLVDRFGRKNPLIIGLVIYAISTLLCALSPTVQWLIGSRFFLSIGGCAGVVVSRTIVRDYFDVKESAKFFSTLMLVMGMAPLLAPMFGSIITVYLGWRYIFFLLLIFTLVLLGAIFFFLPPIKGPDKTIQLKFGNIFSGYLEIFRNPVFLTYGLAGSITYASMFAYISGSPFVYMKVFGLSELHYSWAFSINALGLIMGSQFNRFWLKKAKNETIITISLLSLFLISFLLYIGINFSIFPTLVSMFFICCFLFFLGIINPNTTALAMVPFSKNAGSASALMGGIQMAVSALASAMVSSAFDGTALPMVTGMGICSFSGLIIVSVYIYTKRNRY